jgi:hypothetical protein
VASSDHDAAHAINPRCATERPDAHRAAIAKSESIRRTVADATEPAADTHRAIRIQRHALGPPEGLAVGPRSKRTRRRDFALDVSGRRVEPSHPPQSPSKRSPLGLQPPPQKRAPTDSQRGSYVRDFRAKPPPTTPPARDVRPSSAKPPPRRASLPRPPRGTARG